MLKKKLLFSISGLLLAIVVVAVVVVLVLSRSGKAQSFSTNPQGLKPAVPTPDVVLKNGDTYTLTAEPISKVINGQKIRMLGYNGSVPGPTIKVEQGSTVAIKFVNKTDVDSTLHAHGIRDDNRNDGVPDVTQAPVKPGQSYTYQLQFPDAGAYWYHPHIREDYTQMSGLYGNFLVTPTTTGYWSPVNGQRALMLSDIALKNGAIQPFSTTTVDNTLMGRFGTTLLVNGAANYRQTVAAGSVQRYYVTNAANTRVFRVAIPGVKLKLVGSDNGRVEKERLVDAITLGPSERAIIEAYFQTAGTYQLMQQGDAPASLGTITVAADQKAQPDYAAQFATSRTNSDVAAQIDPFRSLLSSPPQKQLTLGVTMQMKGMSGGSMGSMNNMPGMNMPMSNQPTDGIEWSDTSGGMNATATTKNVSWSLTDPATSTSGNSINWNFKRGDKVKIRLFNDPNSAHPMQHPIHLHGQRFLVASINGVPNTDLAWKDSVLVPNGQTVDIIVDMTNPGKWMLHCHIPEHMEAGMKTVFNVS